MPNLDCTVTNCFHNQDKYCCKAGILVEGAKAKNSSETCCGSFQEKSETSMKNALEQPKKMTDVQCKACDCTYNEDCTCHAESIGVSGSNACSCKETECMTFRCK